MASLTHHPEPDLATLTVYIGLCNSKGSRCIISIPYDGRELIRRGSTYYLESYGGEEWVDRAVIEAMSNPHELVRKMDRPSKVGVVSEAEDYPPAWVVDEMKRSWKSNPLRTLLMQRGGFV